MKFICKKINPFIKAFTLAEVLITLTIIGVVAAITVPTIMQKVQDYAWKEDNTHFKMNINEAMNQMKTNDALTGYPTSDDFVDEFAKYFRIAHRCDSSNLTDCFVSDFKSNLGAEINTEARLKTGADFGKATYTSPLVGIQFNNGVQGIIAYNPDCEYVNPYDNRAIATECLSMVYDLNGTTKPNVIDKDIYTYNATITPASAYLTSVSITGGRTAPHWNNTAFNRDVQNYSITAYASPLTLTLVVEDANATTTVLANNASLSPVSQSAGTWVYSLPLNSGQNTVSAKVNNAGSNQTYAFNITR